MMKKIEALQNYYDADQLLIKMESPQSPPLE